MKRGVKRTWVVAAGVASLTLAEGGAFAEARPLADASARFAERFAEAPLRVVAGHLVTEVTAPDGRSLPVLVGTGNSVTVLTESAAERLGPDPALDLGGVPVRMEGVHTVPDDDLVIAGERLAGQIGANTLAEHDVLFDAPHGRLILALAGSDDPWPDLTLGPPIRLRVFHGIVVSLDVTVEGADLMASLDLGRPETLVNAALVERFGLDGRAALALGLGDRTFHVPFAVSDHPIFERWDPTGQGFAMLGSSFVAECALSVSWVRRELRTCVR